MEANKSYNFYTDETLQEMAYQYLVRYNPTDIIVCPECNALMPLGASACKSCGYKPNSIQVYKTFEHGQIIDNTKVYEVYADDWDEILNKFPWERVCKYMEVTNWRWATYNEYNDIKSMEIPNIDRIQHTVRTLYDNCHKEDVTVTSTGGFSVEKIYNEDEDITYYHVYFTMQS